MTTNKAAKVVQRSVSLVPLAALSCLALSPPAMAVPAATKAKSAQQCLTDLRAFSAVMKKGGYWLDEGGDGYGYPMFGYGYSSGYTGVFPSAGSAVGKDGVDSKGYGRARPGYEVRTLLASAEILAQRGQEQACESVLSATRDTYAAYAADLKSGKVPRGDVTGWRRQQIATAQPVSGSGVAYRSDELIGTSVINGQNDSLGSVEDIVMSPQTGKIAYLVIGHGGLLGFEEAYTPVPWDDFKSTTGSNLLVLAATKSNLAAAPQVNDEQFAPHGDFAAQSKKVDAYWADHLLK